MLMKRNLDASSRVERLDIVLGGQRQQTFDSGMNEG